MSFAVAPVYTELTVAGQQGPNCRVVCEGLWFVSNAYGPSIGGDRSPSLQATLVRQRLALLTLVSYAAGNSAAKPAPSKAPGENSAGPGIPSLHAAIVLFGRDVLCEDTASAWKALKRLDTSDCGTHSACASSTLLFPSFDVFEDSGCFLKHLDGQPTVTRASHTDHTCMRAMHATIAAAHKHLAALIHLDELDATIRSLDATVAGNVLEHSSSKFVLAALQERSRAPLSSAPVLPCLTLSGFSRDPHVEESPSATSSQVRTRRGRAASATVADREVSSGTGAATSANGAADSGSSGTRSTRAARSKDVKVDAGAPSSATTSTTRSKATASRATATRRGCRKADLVSATDDTSNEQAMSVAEPSPAPGEKMVTGAAGRAGSRARPPAATGSRKPAKSASAPSTNSSVGAVQQWLGDLFATQHTNACHGVDRCTLGLFLGSIAAVCTRNCLHVPAAGSAGSTGAEAHVWYSRTASSGVDGQEAPAVVATGAISEVTVAVLLLCAAIAASGVRAPVCAPLLHRLAAVGAAAEMSAVPLACIYAANSLANMHAALLSVATGAEGPAKPENAVSEGHTIGAPGILGVLRCGDGVAWAADGERFALRAVQVISEAVFGEEFATGWVEGQATSENTISERCSNFHTH